MPAVDSLKITVDRESCTGCSACVTEAPETFELDENDVAVVKHPPGDEIELILLAADACPTDAVCVEDLDSGERLSPE